MPAERGRGRARARRGGWDGRARRRGERWPDGSLRPAVEDLWGVGAVADVLARAGRSLSPEARAAVDAYRGVRGEELDALLACASGRELVAGGWEEDVRIAAEVGSSATVPVLVGGRFVDRAGRPLRA